LSKWDDIGTDADVIDSTYAPGYYAFFGYSGVNYWPKGPSLALVNVGPQPVTQA